VHGFAVSRSSEGLGRNDAPVNASVGTMSDMSFVPAEFDPPQRLSTPNFVLEPLVPQHNERDYAAWSSSIEHVRATPGFPDGSWPHEMTPEENRADLERHQRDFTERKGFTYTVLDPGDGDVIGCVYIYPLSDEPGAEASSWVRADRVALDLRLAEAVAAWFESTWPFARVRYRGRPDLSR
jgi:RimJ/RimL family protein N-acetyltransferase